MIRDCKGKKVCKTWRGDHHSLLHMTKLHGDTLRGSSRGQSAVSERERHNPGRSKGETAPVRKIGNGEDNTQSQTVGSLLTGRARTEVVLLRVVPVRVVTEEGRSLTTLGLLDTGSSTTLITKGLADRLAIKRKPESILVNTVLEQGKSQDVSVCSCSLQSVSEAEELIAVPKAYVVPELHVDSKYHPSSLQLAPWEHLHDLSLSTHVDLEAVTVLIGENVPLAHAVLESRYGSDPQNQPYAVRTALGWCVAGPLKGETGEGVEINNISVRQAESSSSDKDMAIAERVERWWQEERHGFMDTEVKCMSVEDCRALVMLENGTRQTSDGHYEIGLLWKNEQSMMPSNRVVAEKRLGNLKRRFEREPQFAEMYRAAMEGNFEKGFAKVVDQRDSAQSGREWYLPHHGVVSVNKPGRVRVVFDAAAEFKGTSLNKELLSGPDLNNGLIGVLLRFREHKIAVMADIKEMFLQFKVPSEDCNALKFLWWTDGMENPPVVCQMTRHIFGAKDSPCACIYGLRQCSKDYGNKYPEAARAVAHSFYVDDFLKAFATVAGAIAISLGLIALLDEGRMKLMKFVSNSEEVLQGLPEELCAPGVSSVCLDSERNAERALGIRWKVEEDKLGLHLSKKHLESEGDVHNTRRECLAVVASIYDPLGIVSPTTLIAKRILQLTCQRKLAWDEPMPDDLLQIWKEWKESLPGLSEVSVPRWYFKSEENGQLELHHFCDASEVGYGSVCYVRKIYDDGRIECAFVMAKSRTAPSQFVSVPRLELQAAVVAVRLDGLVRRELELPINRVCFWSDSKIVISYIHSESRRFKTYVASRVSEIHGASRPDQWRHISGKENPADLASRGKSVKDFLKSEQWLRGPKFLWQNEEEWPIAEVKEIQEDDPEVKQERIIGAVDIAEGHVKDNGFADSIDKLFRRYSSWDRLLRAVAILRKFGQYLKDKESVCKEITPDELTQARNAIVRCVQRVEFAGEIKDLEKLGRVKRSSSLKSLNPVVIEGILRVGGRIAKAPVSFDCSFPMILPKRHHISTLLIRHIHRMTAHAGQEHVLAKIREQFWIPQARSYVKQQLRDCIGCRKMMGRRLTQKMAALPRFRLAVYDPPFTRTGIDYYGPMMVKRGRSNLKRWGGSVYVHERQGGPLAESLETSAFLNALRRFVGRRGCPTDIWSDNGSNFVGAERELKAALVELNQEAKGELAQKGIRWHFQPPGGCHMSGVWERLVKSTKRALKAILGESLVSDEVLHTVHVEVEAILNSRPLCKASEDPKDEEPLTPSHFLMQRRAMTLPPGEFVEQDKFQVRKQWRQTQVLSNHFWKRFVKEYLTTLQERGKWQLKQQNLKDGDLVLVADDDMIPRGRWPLAVVTETYPGDDGCVRVVQLRTGGGITLKRPVSKLCLLEESSGDVDTVAK